MRPSTTLRVWKFQSLQMCHWKAKLQLVAPTASKGSRHRYGHDACASNLREILEKSCPSDLFLLQICMVCCVHPREVVFCLFISVASLHRVFHRECYLRESNLVSHITLLSVRNSTAVLVATTRSHRSSMEGHRCDFQFHS